MRRTFCSGTMLDCHPARRRERGIADIAAWLLDAKRSGFVTAANFVVDGGMTRKTIYAE